VMAGAHCVVVECQESRIDFRMRTRYVDHKARSIEEALAIIERATEPTSVGLLGNAAELIPKFVAIAKSGGPRPSAVTDQTSAHDLVNG
ncbi:urocanate hydratase, partial [Pseudomonas sp. GW704-F2]